ncbi:rod shape-determining protein MreC [uncultured Roseivirga sp.]|uniref:rod shape-determining protein MreC n=1 Tax=uncultured Roseivirga sp. TaxID=543088 RepID=UPI000D78D09F|nr:rod shape-determining protein MreC [uncultured Roseivirga sp.]PWL30897.1 MAG: rod shape-determining protein MreC [Roseivirga sp. XM-24bin3]
MGQLLSFLYRFRAFFTFLLLEFFCIWLIVRHNDYQRSSFTKTTAGVVGSVNQTTANITEYFSLKKVNEELAQENARLKSLLLSNRAIPFDSLTQLPIASDTSDSLSYELIPAEIVRNSIRNANNFFMINKGSNDGIEPGMGVINSLGVVGKIRDVRGDFAQGISLLNTRNPISAKHKITERMGTVLWEGVNPQVAKLLYLTPDVRIEVGDTIVTSSFNSIFPKEIMIGTVRSSEPDKNNTYLNIEIDLSVEFGSLSFVYVIKNNEKPELDSLINSNPQLF